MVQGRQEAGGRWKGSGRDYHGPRGVTSQRARCWDGLQGGWERVVVVVMHGGWLPPLGSQEDKGSPLQVLSTAQDQPISMGRRGRRGGEEEVGQGWGWGEKGGRARLQQSSSGSRRQLSGPRIIAHLDGTGGC